MPLGADLSSLRITFYLERTRSRVTKIRALAKALKLPDPVGLHWLNASFLAPKPSNLVFSLHIDSTYVEDDETPARPTGSLWTEIWVRRRPSSKAPAKISANPDSDWMVRELSKLVQEDSHELAFFDGEVHIPPDVQVPSNVVAVPLTVGNRTLPVIGVEYGGEPEAGSVEAFRWTRSPHPPHVLRVKLSYSREIDLAKLSEIWDSERARIGAYVQEALTR